MQRDGENEEVRSGVYRGLAQIRVSWGKRQKTTVLFYWKSAQHMGIMEGHKRRGRQCGELPSVIPGARRDMEEGGAASRRLGGQPRNKTTC